MPKKFPPEFQRDVVEVARRGGLSQAEVAADFVISVEWVRRRVRQADIDDAGVDGVRGLAGARASVSQAHRRLRVSAAPGRGMRNGCGWVEDVGCML